MGQSGKGTLIAKCLPYIFSESIFGYKDLRVQIYYSAARLNTYIGMTHTDKVTPKKFDGIQVFNFRTFYLKVCNQKLTFLISQTKHMLLVLKRTASMKCLFENPKQILKLMDKNIFAILHSTFLFI